MDVLKFLRCHVLAKECLHTQSVQFNVLIFIVEKRCYASVPDFNKLACEVHMHLTNSIKWSMLIEYPRTKAMLRCRPLVNLPSLSVYSKSIRSLCRPIWGRFQIPDEIGSPVLVTSKSSTSFSGDQVCQIKGSS